MPVTRAEQQQQREKYPELGDKGAAELGSRGAWHQGPLSVKSRAACIASQPPSAGPLSSGRSTLYRSARGDSGATGRCSHQSRSVKMIIVMINGHTLTTLQEVVYHTSVQADHVM